MINRRAGVDAKALSALAASVFASFTGWSLTSVTVSWLAVHASQSAMLVAGTLSARLLSFAIAGLPAGAISERIGPRALLLSSNLVSAGLGLGFLLLFSARWDTSPAALLGFSAVFGTADAARTVATSNAAYELGRHRNAIRVMAAIGLAAAAGQMAGGAVGGSVTDRFGVAASSLILAASFLAGATLILPMQSEPARRRTATGLLTTLRVAFGLITTNAAVRALVAIAIAAEVLAFSSIAVEPLYAGRVFAVGASGLGLLTAMRAVGRLVASLGLIAVETRSHAGQLLVAAVAGYGVALVALAVAPDFAVALVAVMATGLFGCLVDALEQFLLPAVAGAGGSGRAAGLWVFALGWGPLGFVQVGLLADVAGPRSGPAVDSVAVLAIAAGLAAASVGARLTAAAMHPGRSSPEAILDGTIGARRELPCQRHKSR